MSFLSGAHPKPDLPLAYEEHSSLTASVCAIIIGAGEERMTDPDQLREAVRRVIAQVFEERMPALRDEVARRVLDELGTADLVSAPGETSISRHINEVLACIQDSPSQVDILAALLDGVARFGRRAALFVVRGPTAQGWQARGLTDNEAIKSIGLDINAGLAARAVQTRVSTTGPAADLDAQFSATFGEPADGTALVLPLVVRDKVAALVYSDAGTEAGGRVDVPASELLVRAAAVWIELSIARRNGPAPAAEPTPAAMAMAAAVSTGITSEDEPADSVAAAASSASSAVATVPPPAAVPEPEPDVPPPSPAPVIAPEEEEVHRKARRFAKLLVEEIKLYNQAQVAEGRLKEDLYERLQDDIDKSRASYEKRYGQTAAASADYFTQELIRVLADGNSSLLGSSFPR